MSYSFKNPQVIPYNQQPAMGLNAPQVDQEKIKSGVNQSVNDSPVTKIAKPKDNPLLSTGTILAGFPLIYIGIDKFGKACQGDYEKTFLYKLDNFDNKITGGIKKVIGEKNATKIKTRSSKVKEFINTKIIDKSAFLRAFFKTPAEPEVNMAKVMGKGIPGEIAREGSELLEKYITEGPKKELTLKDTIKPKSGKMYNKKRLKELGFKDLEDFDNLRKNIHLKENIDRVERICKEQGKKAAYEIQHAIKIPLSQKITGEAKYLTDYIPFLKKAFCRKVEFSEFANKLRAVSKPGSSRAVLKIVEGLVNAGAGAVGGKGIAAIMGAWFISDAVVRTVQAPKGKGEKFKTFMENMIYNVGFYVTMPLAINTMHRFGGLRYLGMTEDQVKEYKAKRENFNKKVDNYDFEDKTITNKRQRIKATKKLYKEELKEIKKLRQGKTMIKEGDKFFTRTWKVLKRIFFGPIKGLADKVYMVGNGQLKSLKIAGESRFVGIMSREKGYWLREGLAYPMRMGLFMLAFAPFFAKFFAKGSHAIFGKPKYSVLDEGKEEAQPADQAAKQAAAVNQAKAQAQAVQQAQQIQAINKQNNTGMMNANNTNKMAYTQTKPVKKENLLDMYSTNTTAKREFIASNKTKGPVRNYIPSSDPVKLVNGPYNETTEDRNKVQTSLSKANRVEQEAIKYLK